MVRFACYSAYGLAFALGAVIMFAGDAIGLPFIDVPIWRLLGIAIAVFALWRIASTVFGRKPEAPRADVPSKAGDVMLMKSPRIQSDRRTGPGSRILIGR